MFYNISNHPSSKWSEGQLAAAKQLGGEIRDIAFPNVPPTATFDDVTSLALATLKQLPGNSGDVYMVQGEFSLTYTMTSLLGFLKARVVVACSDRKVVERQLEDGKTSKEAVFEFVQFRDVLKHAS